MNLKQQVKYYEKKLNKKPLYKGGVDTPISNKHFYGFNKRFYEENAEVLKEAREEMEKIRKKRREAWLKKRSFKELPEDYKKVVVERNQFIRSIKKEI